MLEPSMPDTDARKPAVKSPGVGQGGRGSPRDGEDKWRRRLTILAQIGLGLGLGLVLTEVAFTTRDQGAFPHVNFYVPDTELGARLEPGASMAFRLGDNPLTHISVNSHGYRGSEWPSAAPDRAEILTVGDSQVFGLGVDDDQTFSAVLAEQLDRTVLNAGVPTYGPPEYFSTTQAVLAERPVGTVVYVLNFLNDPFELERRNVDRHAIWDGWAVQIETAPRPDDIVEFPGRRWLMSKSHTVYAARRWWHSSDEAWFARVDRGLPSEGAWTDLLVDGDLTRTRVSHAELEATLLITDAETRTQKLIAALAELDEDLQRAEADLTHETGRDEQILAARPGAIIRDRYSESARDIEVTAEVYQAALERRRERVAVRKRYDALASARQQLLAKLEGVPVPARPAAPEPRRPPSVFGAHFAELRSLCDRNGAELLVVMLPFDVQVSADEWAKYGVEDGPDMAATLVLIDDAMASAAQLGIATLDATPILRAAEPGAFLDADIHMTPKGHAALAKALADALTLPKPDLPKSKQAKSESKK
jgi:hypothetical protein